MVHGNHTEGPPNDWKDFDMEKDAKCLRGLTRDSSGLSLVETAILLGKITGNKEFTTNKDTGEDYFGTVDIFISYGWHGTSLGNLKQAIEFFQVSKQEDVKHNNSGCSNIPQYFWIDIFAIAQNRDTPERKAANAADVSAFADVVQASEATALYWSPFAHPAVLGRVWCLYEILETHKAGNNLELLLEPDVRKELLESIAKDYGRSLCFLVEGQSSVNAASTYENDWCRIHTSIEVELNPKSMGTFVRAPDEISNGGNESEGWLEMDPG